MQYFDDFQNLCKRTASKTFDLKDWTLGLVGEVGEFADMVKKLTSHKVDISIDDMEKELGDVLFYVAALCNYLGLDMGTVAEKNVEKLKKRYPQGFTEGGGVR